MKAHLRYLRYVILHKLYVFAGGIAVANVWREQGWSRSWVAWVWRLLVHDLSKLRPSEWRPYADYFYGPKLEGPFAREQRTRFNRAWLLHQHRNPHHWQHHVLREDSGKTIVLLPESWLIDEMVADWIGAGTKVLARPTLAECVAETVKWYAANHQNMVLREPAKKRVEETLMLLSAKYGLVTAALQVRAAEQARASIIVPGR